MSTPSGTSEAPRFTGRTAWARSVQTPLREFLRTETGGAAALLAAALAALVWVNVDSSSYDSLWTTTLSIRVGGAGGDPVAAESVADSGYEGFAYGGASV